MKPDVHPPAERAAENTAGKKAPSRDGESAFGPGSGRSAFYGLSTPGPRRMEPLSWGEYEACRRLLAALFVQMDATARPFEMLPEYDEIARWMTDTRGQGLLLYGDCGRGKTVIVRYVVPALFALKGLQVTACPACDFARRQQAVRVSGGDDPETVLDLLRFARYPAVDDVGTEPPMNDFGVRYEGFPLVMAAAEDRLRPVFVSTNLSPEALDRRYGTRTLDRIGRLCRPVEFCGPSLR